MQNSNKFLRIAVLLLLTVNIGLVAMMVFKKNNRGRSDRPDPVKMMAKELGLTEEQETVQRQMKEEHMKTIRPLIDSLKDAKINFYMLNKEAELNDSMLNAYGDMIAAFQSRIDKATISHFKKVRASLNPGQQPKFDTLVKKMMSRGRRDSAQKTK